MQSLKRLFLVGAVILVLAGMALPLHAATPQGPTRGQVYWVIEEPTAPERPSGPNVDGIVVPPMRYWATDGVVRTIVDYVVQVLVLGRITSPLSW